MNTFTCRPCKEQNNWEIVEPSGKVQSKHYNSKEECVAAAQSQAYEIGAELFVQDQISKNNN